MLDDASVRANRMQRRNKTTVIFTCVLTGPTAKAFTRRMRDDGVRTHIGARITHEIPWVYSVNTEVTAARRDKQRGNKLRRRMPRSR